MRARIDITEVETRTKIRAKYLRAIENEEWDLLPGPVYIKSFLRTYGDYLGLDSRMLIDEFKRRYERPNDNEQRSMSSISRDRERRARPPRGPLLPSWAIIGLVLVVVVAVLYAIGSGSGGGSKPPPTGAHASVRHRHTATQTTSTLPVKPPAPASAELKLVPTAAVYVCVVTKSGKELIPGVIYQSGQTIPTEKRRVLMVTLGNNSVQLTVNGKAYPVAASTGAIGLKVTPSAVTPLPAGQDPTCTATG